MQLNFFANEAYLTSIAWTGQFAAASSTEASKSAGISPKIFSALPSALSANTASQIDMHIPHPMQESFTLQDFAIVENPPYAFFIIVAAKGGFI